MKKGNNGRLIGMESWKGSPSRVAAKTPHLGKQNGFEKAETNSHLSSDHVEMLGIYSWKIGQFKEKTQ